MRPEVNLAEYAGQWRWRETAVAVAVPGQIVQIPANPKRWSLILCTNGSGQFATTGPIPTGATYVGIPLSASAPVVLSYRDYGAMVAAEWSIYCTAGIGDVSFIEIYLE